MEKVENNEVRLRFAPSPTGFVHIGNLRSALFGYFLAKSKKGKFILRLEDTDQKREVEGSLERLLEVFSWLKIDFDEGPHKKGKYGPYIQSKRLDKYQPLIEELLEKDEAYPCFCSAERLEKMRKEQQEKKLPPRYDKKCRQISKSQAKKRMKAGEKFVIRQKMPLEGIIEVTDELRGKIKFAALDLEDHVLIKSNGVPTYQFANIVDDHLMDITHVTRGDEWLPSFPKNILLYKAFNWQAPKFIHLPLILNKNGGKLSKRQGDVFVEDYQKKGYLPEALINFCALLGWHPKNDKEILSLKEIEQEFSLKGMGSSPAIFDEEKLNYLNGYYLRQKKVEELADMCLPYLKELDSFNKKKIDNEQLKRIVYISRERMKKLEDIKELSEFIFSTPEYEKELLIWKKSTQEEAKKNLEQIYNFLKDNISEKDWNLDFLEKNTLTWIKEIGGKNGDYLWPLRVSLSGLKNSPSPFEIAWTLKKEETLKRIEKAISYL